MYTVYSIQCIHFTRTVGKKIARARNRNQLPPLDVLLLYICAAINSDQGYFYLTHLVMQRLVEGSIVTYAKWL